MKMHKIKDEKIIGDRIYLRELNLADATGEYCGWLNDPAVNKYLETRKATIEDLRNYIQQRVDDPNSFFAGVFDKENNVHIGNVKLEPIDWQKKRAVFGILIGNKDYWSKGIGTEATRLIIDYAFNSMGLEEIELGVIADNKKAARVYEKVGFKIVKIKEKAINHEGVLYDDIVMVIK